MSHREPFTLQWFIALTWLGFAISMAVQPLHAGIVDEINDDATDQFLPILLANPRFGTAFDRVTEWYTDRGAIADLEQALCNVAKLEVADDADIGIAADVEAVEISLPTQTDAGAASLVVGMLRLQHGDERAAIAPLKQAAEFRGDDPIASWYLARAHAATGSSLEAAAAYESALQRQTARIDAIEIHRELARTWQRAGEHDKAREVWLRLEAAFPGDLRVREQIAESLAADGRWQDALARYEQLARDADDADQRVLANLAASDMLRQLGRLQDAVKLLEDQLTQLDPESWLHSDIRRRIESVYRDANDLPGLVAYYEHWITTHDDDVDAVSRLASILSIQDRSEDATNWYLRAIELAPGNVTIRKSYIEQLERDDRIAEAITQYEVMADFDNGNADHLVARGRLWLQRAELPESERQASAAAVWEQLLDGHEDDAPALARVAELMKQAALSDRAIELYEQAIAAAPDEPQYREYLGQYLFQLERPDEAMAVWMAMAAEPRRTKENLVRLAEVLSSFGRSDETITTMREACTMQPELSDHIALAALLRDTIEKRRGASPPAAISSADPLFTESFTQLNLAESLATSDDEQQQVLDERIKTLVASGELANEIARMSREIANREGSDREGEAPAEPLAVNHGSAGASPSQYAPSRNAPSQRWLTLALFQNAAEQLDDAISSARKAVELDPKLVRGWTLLADVYERTGRLGDAADALRSRIALDPRGTSDALMKIARLEVRLGRFDAAYQAGRDLIRATPGNPEAYQVHADLCFEIGRPNDAMAALRQSVRVSPGDTASLIALAKSLADDFHTPEAMELLWRAFDKASDMNSQNAILVQLTNLALRSNRFDALIERIRQTGREHNQANVTAQWLATAFSEAGEFQTAREVLERLDPTTTDQVTVLSQLQSLATRQHDDAAVKEYQRQIVEAAPTVGNVSRYRAMLEDAGLMTKEINEELSRFSGISPATVQEATPAEPVDPDPTMNATAATSSDDPVEIADRAASITALNKLADQIVLSAQRAPLDLSSYERVPLLDASLDEDSQFVLSDALSHWKGESADIAVVAWAVADKAPASENLQAVRWLFAWELLSDDQFVPRDVALLPLIRAAELVPDAPLLRLAVVWELADKNMPDEVFALLDELDDELPEFAIPVLQFDIEFSRKHERPDRIRRALEKLFALPVAAEVFSDLIDDYEKFELNAQARAIKSRLGRGSETRQSVLTRRLVEFESQGRNDLAGEAAWELLKLASGGDLFSGLRPNDDRDDGGDRLIAIKALSRLKRLQPLIDRYETMLAASPTSIDLLEILSEFHEAAEQWPQLTDKRDRIARLANKVPPSLKSRAIQLERAGDTSAACDLYLQFLETDPASFSAELESYVQLFERAKRLDDLLEGLMKCGLSEFKLQTSNIVTAAALRLDQDASSPIPERLCLQLLDRHATLTTGERAELLRHLLQRPGLVSRDRLVTDAGDTVFRAASHLDRMAIVDRCAEMESVLAMLNEVREPAEIAFMIHSMMSLSGELQEHDSSAATLLLYLQASAGQTEEVSSAISKLLNNGDRPIRRHSLLAAEAAMSRLSGDWTMERISVLERRLHQDSIGKDGTYAEPDVTAFQQLVSLYEEHGLHEKARQLVIEDALRSVHAERGRAGSADWVRRILQGAERVQHSGFPVDAVKLLQSVTPQDMEAFTARLEEDKAIAFKSRFKASERWARQQMTAVKLVEWFEGTVENAARHVGASGEGSRHAGAAEPHVGTRLADQPADLLLELRGSDNHADSDPPDLQSFHVHSVLLDAIVNRLAVESSPELVSRIQAELERVCAMPDAGLNLLATALVFANAAEDDKHFVILFPRLRQAAKDAVAAAVMSEEAGTEDAARIPDELRAQPATALLTSMLLVSPSEFISNDDFDGLLRDAVRLFDNKTSSLLNIALLIDCIGIADALDRQHLVAEFEPLAQAAIDRHVASNTVGTGEDIDLAKEVRVRLLGLPE